MVSFVNGDITGATSKYIVHQVNCQGVMGAGVAKALYTKWPNVRGEYKAFCNQHSEQMPADLLGAVLATNVYPPNRGLREQTILHVFGQESYRHPGDRYGTVYTNYDALRRGLEYIANVCVGEQLAIPYKIGCGLAGGDWRIVYPMICDIFARCHVCLYKL